MNIDITPYIKELLFESNNLVIPEFGALTLKYAPSTIDHVQGLLNPPTKSINFDKNLVVNDGKLINIIQEKHQVSQEEAKRQISRFVNIMKDQLDRREMVNIAGVGRLYKDFENNIQFIPDSTNFNKEAFGLPTVNFHPILRDKVSAETIVPSGSNTRTYKPQKAKTFAERFQDFIEEHSWVPAALAAILFLVIGGLVLSRVNFSSDDLANKKVNESPVEVTTSQETALVAEEENGTDEDAIDYAEEQALAEAEDSDIIDTESSTLSPNQRIAVVSVGIFGSKSNAQRRIEQVYEYGYDALPNKYTKKGKKLTQVGIQFAFETEEEFEETIRHIKKRFKDAKVIRKE
ncbi:MAG: HU family DNA-binding protein [Bacteroidota bacterium]